MKSIKVFALVLAMFILSGCGKEVEVHNTETSISSETKVEETKQETEVEETEQEIEVNVTTESNVTAQTKEETIETNVVVESETVSEEDAKIEFNGTSYEGTLQETVQSYITYTNLEPTLMYVISNTTGEAYPTYIDPNITDGALMPQRPLSQNEEVTIDGKATYNNTDYYRIAYKEGSMIDYQLIIPADYLTTEKQTEQAPVETEKPVETQKPVEQQPQQPEVQQPEVQQPVAEPSTPGYDPSCGISEEDWNKLFGGGNSNTNHNWSPDHGDDFKSERNENGGFSITDSSIDPDTIGKLTFQ